MRWTYLTPSDKKVHYYDVSLDNPVQKDGANYTIDWADPTSANQQGDELYRGIASAFAPDIYDNAPAGVTLVDTGTGFVIANVGGGEGEIGMRPVSFYIVFFPNTLGAAEGVTVNEMYAFNIKYAPYSGAVSYFKMFDPTVPPVIANEQPFANANLGNGGPNGAPFSCNFGIGDTFQNLLTNCIDVFTVSAALKGTDADPNVIAENKVLGGLTHDDQNYTFNVVGIGQNFRSVKLDVCTPALKAAGTNCGTDIEDVVHDTDSLVADAKNSTANEFTSDVRSFGAIQNDAYPPGTPLGIACTAATGTTDCAAAPVAALCDTSGDLRTTTSASRRLGTTTTTAAAPSGVSTGDLVQTGLNLESTSRSTTTTRPSRRAGTIRAATSRRPATAASARPPATCTTAGGHWGVGSSMEMTPITACTAANAATVCNPTRRDLQRHRERLQVSRRTPASSRSTPATGVRRKVAPASRAWSTTRSRAATVAFSSRLPTTISGTTRASGPRSAISKPGDPYARSSATTQAPSTSAIRPWHPERRTSSRSLPLRVLAFLGNGNVLQVPEDGRDKRYFFQQWSTAYAKYLISPAIQDSGLQSAGAVVGGTCTTSATCAVGASCITGYCTANGNRVRDFGSARSRSTPTTSSSTRSATAAREVSTSRSTPRTSTTTRSMSSRRSSS